tara:strand:+ start:3067 stop:3924 length:858 start_codon:yes stop_codon:yes gene_type:complete
MGFKKIKQFFQVAYLCIAITCFSYVMSVSMDFSRSRGEKHQKTPVTREIENSEGKKYALLVNAGEYFKNRVKFAYASLRRAGFSDDSITVLESVKNPESYVDGKADYETLKTTLNRLKKEIKPNDTFLLYTTNHGKRRNIVSGESELFLEGRTISASQLKELYQGLNPNYTFAIFSQCHGQGFAAQFGEDNLVSMSAAGRGKASFKEKYNPEGFDFQIFSAIGGETPEGKKVNPDVNDDGKVSIDEIFEYNAQNNLNTKPRLIGYGKETPQMFWQNANPRNLHIR